MAKLFNTIKAKPTDKQLKEAYELYKHDIESLEDREFTYEEFLTLLDLDEFIDMKCLYCHREQRDHFRNYKLELDIIELPFPITWCYHCEKQYLVFKDIYNKLIK